MDIVTLALAKQFTRDTVIGMGTIKGDKGDKGADGTDGISPVIAVDTSTDSAYILSITDKNGTVLTPNLKGAKGDTGAQGIRGEKGEQGVQGIQGADGAKGDKGDKGDDGYPFLIYKQYDSISEFDASDFPEIGLMFMVMTWVDDNGYPIYRYTGNGNYSLITYMNTTGIKGEKGDKGDKGDTGEKGTDGLNGSDGTTYIPAVGTVTTLEPDVSATVSVSLDDVNQLAVFNFGIPKGRPAVMTFDDTPTENSANPVTSDGIYQALQNAVTDEVTDGDTRAVTSNAVFDYTKALKALFSPTKRIVGEGIRKFLDESNTYTKTATVTGVYQFTLFKHNHGNTVTISVNGVRQCSCPSWGTNSGETVTLEQTDICYTPTIFVNKGDVITISSDNSGTSGTSRWFVNNVNYWGIEE